MAVPALEDRRRVAPEVDGLEPEPFAQARFLLEHDVAVAGDSVTQQPAGTFQVDEVDGFSVERFDQHRKKGGHVERGGRDEAEIPIRPCVCVTPGTGSEKDEQPQPARRCGDAADTVETCRGEASHAPMIAALALSGCRARHVPPRRR